MVSNAPQVEWLYGSIERVMFHHDGTGFCALRVHVHERQDLVTVVGHLLTVAIGEYVECCGTWVNDKRHGLQFRAEQLVVLPPTTKAGIEKYLSSGMVKGIGPQFAKKLIEAFGDKVFHVIEYEPERLMMLEGIGEKRKDQVVLAWAEQKDIRNIMMFLQSYGLGTAKAVRIYQAYGKDAIDLVCENPYRLVADIQGMGFKLADNLAKRLDFDAHSLLRAQAGVSYVLQHMCERGHCAVFRSHLVAASCKLLAIDASTIEEAITAAVLDGQLIEEENDEETCIYPLALYQAEHMAAAHVKRLSEGHSPWGNMDVDHLLTWVEKETQCTLSSSQEEALRVVVEAKLAIITGGPGVGKTTLIHHILMMVRAKNLHVALCAPTGRAAKRLTEATHVPAKTIHRMLQFDPHAREFHYTHDNPMPLDILIIDESSMLDIMLLRDVLSAVPDHAAVIFIGDRDQLPSVGSGAVLSDLMASGVIPVVRLTHIFRQAASSKIVANAYRVNQGDALLPNERENSDFFTLYAETPEEIHHKLMHVVCERLPRFYQCDPIRDIQVLTPMNKGGLGTKGLNVSLQQRLNGHEALKMTRLGVTFARGDKVIQMSNNYDKDVFNGDLGVIQHVDLEEGRLIVDFDQQLKTYEGNELDELSLAYAISIHKSQGSEFPIVVMPLSTQHYMLLARNVLYTGMTRGKKVVVLIGQKRAIEIAINNDQESHRFTRLAKRLKDI